LALRLLLAGVGGRRKPDHDPGHRGRERDHARDEYEDAEKAEKGSHRLLE
jgi:hypothetical protein